MNEYIAGFLSGIVNVFVGYPFDTIKVKMQTQKLSIGQIKVREIHSLYKGVAVPLTTVPIQNSLVFGSYCWARKMYNKELGFVEHFICGGFAGFVYSYISCPTELIKIKAQTSLGKVTNIFSQTIQANGIKGLYVGWRATVCREISGFGIQFATYEYMKKQFQPDITLIQNMFCGGMSGVVSWIANYPIDTIKNITQHSETRICYSDTIKQTIKNKQLFRGIAPCLLRVAIVDSLAFPTYEVIVKILSKN
jgi:solute carrier family 25 carnitine/acylcarnitine transporter 20/29